MVALHDAGADERWKDAARALAGVMTGKFGDAGGGGFYFTEAGAADQIAQAEGRDRQSAAQRQRRGGGGPGRAGPTGGGGGHTDGVRRGDGVAGRGHERATDGGRGVPARPRSGRGAGRTADAVAAAPPVVDGAGRVVGRSDTAGDVGRRGRVPHQRPRAVGGTDGDTTVGLGRRGRRGGGDRLSAGRGAAVRLRRGADPGVRGGGADRRCGSRPNGRPFAIAVSYQACDDRTCLRPATVEVAV